MKRRNIASSSPNGTRAFFGFARKKLSKLDQKVPCQRTMLSEKHDPAAVRRRRIKCVSAPPNTNFANTVVQYSELYSESF